MRAIWPGALLAVYLAATGALLFVERTSVGTSVVAAHFGVLAAIVAATWLRPVPRWLQLWAPLLALLFLYTEMPTLIRAAGHQHMYDGMVMRWEQAIFDGQPALEWAARLPSQILSETLHLAYLAYYPIIFSVPAALFAAARRTEFSEAVFALMLTFVACLLAYIAFPVAGPRYLWPSPSSPQGPARSVVVWLLEARSSRGTAFPSSHVAIAVAQSILAIRYFGAKGSIVAIMSLGLALGAVYGGFHYAVDVLAGALVGGLVCVIGIVVATRRAREVVPQANATAPT